MGEDEGRGPDAKEQGEHFSQVHLASVDGACCEALFVQEGVSRIQRQDEHTLLGSPGKLCAHEFKDVLRGGEAGALFFGDEGPTAYFQCDQQAGGLVYSKSLSQLEGGLSEQGFPS